MKGSTPMKKTLFLLLNALVLILLFAGCSTEKTTGSDVTDAATAKVFTLEELSKYNGKDGMEAYVAISGTVYDVSAIPEWNNGDHNGYEAGV
ncbi:MAG: hypothetical protein H7X94_05125, partial [Vallitaleaceae bacterium]|nr:hypothetical protein [Vallitaleaceae bacterium]